MVTLKESEEMNYHPTRVESEIEENTEKEKNLPMRRKRKRNVCQGKRKRGEEEEMNE